MSEQILQRGTAVERSRTRTIAQVAMLGAVAGVLMNLEFPIPFLAPSFYQLDFSEVPVMVGTFAMGPVAGILIELVKILVHLVTKGTMTAGVGDVANFLFGCAYVVPAGLIYRFRHKKSRVQTLSIFKEPKLIIFIIFAIPLFFLIFYFHTKKAAIQATKSPFIQQFFCRMKELFLQK